MGSVRKLLEKVRTISVNEEKNFDTQIKKAKSQEDLNKIVSSIFDDYGIQGELTAIAWDETVLELENLITLLNKSSEKLYDLTA